MFHDHSNYRQSINSILTRNIQSCNMSLRKNGTKYLHPCISNLIVLFHSWWIFIFDKHQSAGDSWSFELAFIIDFHMGVTISYRCDLQNATAGDSVRMSEASVHRARKAPDEWRDAGVSRRLRSLTEDEEQEILEVNIHSSVEWNSLTIGRVLTFACTNIKNNCWHTLWVYWLLYTFTDMNSLLLCATGQFIAEWEICWIRVLFLHHLWHDAGWNHLWRDTIAWRMFRDIMLSAQWFLFAQDLAYIRTLQESSTCTMWIPTLRIWFGIMLDFSSSRFIVVAPRDMQEVTVRQMLYCFISLYAFVCPPKDSTPRLWHSSHRNISLENWTVCVICIVSLERVRGG